MSRAGVRGMCCGVVALLVLALPVVAEEVLGVLSKVDLDTKTVTVVGSDEKEVEIKVTDETEYVTPKRTGKIDLERVAKGVARAQEKGRKGIGVTVTHEDGVASKIEVKARGKRRTAAERAR